MGLGDHYGSPVNNQAVATQFDESMRGKRIVQNLDVGVQQVFQLSVAHVPHCHEQQPRRSSRQQVRADEICVFGNHDTVVPARELYDELVGCAISVRQIKCVQYVAAVSNLRP